MLKLTRGYALMAKTLLLILILLMAFIPHIGYAYPPHLDEWMRLTCAKTIAQTGAANFPDPFTGYNMAKFAGNFD